jgi:hypothetical protein
MLSATALVSALTFGCGGGSSGSPGPSGASSPPAAPAAKASDAGSETLAKGDSTEQSGEKAKAPEKPDAAQDPAKSEPAKNAAPIHDKAPSSQAPREVEYKVTPEGLVIVTDGVTMKPRAKAVKIKGGWGVEVSVEVTTDKLRFLTNPENGPLAFAGSVTTTKETKAFTDERKGSDALNVQPGDPKTITRTFPGKGQQPLWWGEKLELTAGLWGLGNDGERRPLNKLFKLTFEAREGAKPLILPPDVK